MIKDLLYRGSVKDIYNTDVEDELVFKFSDRYSVFDWGEMPDHIEKKGEALSYLGQVFFRYLVKADVWKDWRPRNITLGPKEEEILARLSREGMQNHFVGPVEGEARAFQVKKIHVENPGFDNGTYDYKAYNQNLEMTLIPLEVIFRFGLPEGSSLLNRIDDIGYRRILGLNHRPAVGETFNRPLIEFSTKLEATDRYVSYTDAQAMAGLSDMEFARLHGLTTLLGLRLKDLFEEFGIELWDGKFEFAFSHPLSGNLGRDIILVDSIGPDELRLVWKGHKLSKEFLRSYYRETKWLESVTIAKKMGRDRGVKDWKSIVINELHQEPEKLDERYYKTASSMYLCLANVIGRNLFGETPFPEAPEFESLDELFSSLKS